MQRLLAPEIIAEGVIKQNGTVSHDDHLITRGYLHGNVLNAIHPDSANYLEAVADNGVTKLKVKPLTITDTTVDSSNSTLAGFVSNVYTGTSHQEGDIVLLSTASPVEAYVHNGGTAGTAADWDQINTGLSDAQIRALFSAGNALSYNSSTGQFAVVEDDIRAMFSAGTGLSFNAGQFALSANTDQVSEGSSNLYYLDSRVDAHLSGGTGIGYANGVISFNGDSDDVSEGSSNLYYLDSRVDAHLSGGTGIGYANGVISFNGDTDDVSEGSSNRYFTEQRVIDTLDVATAPAGDQQLATFSATGDISVLLSSIRKEFTNQTLSANTALALTHNLGKQCVQVSAMDSSGNAIELEKVFTSANVVTVESAVGLTGVVIAVSL